MVSGGSWYVSILPALFPATWSRVVLQLIPVNAQTTLGIARTSIFKKEEIAKTNAWLEGLPPAEQPIELLKWAHKTIAADTWVLFTSFGANDSRVHTHPCCWGVQRWRASPLDAAIRPPDSDPLTRSQGSTRIGPVTYIWDHIHGIAPPLFWNFLTLRYYHF
jgi:hypothetical protein